MKVLFLDAYNLIHRARSGFSQGEHPIIYNFFRGVRPIIEKFSPDKVYFVLEGYPKFRSEISGGNYKANRPNPGNSFHRQKAAIIDLVSAHFPFDTIKHPDLECDDTIATMASIHCKNSDDVTIVSSDSDFIQLLNAFDNLRIYHPIKKKFVEKPEYDYVMWKALRGDLTDNISGIPGVGDKTADKLMRNPELLQEKLSNPVYKQIFENNVNLIRLVDFSDNLSVMESKTGDGDFEQIYAYFDELGFDSMLKEKTWSKYVQTFGGLV